MLLSSGSKILALSAAAIIGFEPKVDVGICCISVNDKVLLLKKAEHAAMCPGTWGMPGGKLEPKEKALFAVAREIKEETGIIIPTHNIHLVTNLFCRVPSIDARFHLFKTRLSHVPENIKLDQNEHSEHKWYSFSELKSSKLPLMFGELEMLDLVKSSDKKIKINLR